jgi:glutamate dehydrogenase (NAD(P)+)
MTHPLLRTHWTDPLTGVEGWLVLDRLENGMAGGGIRMRDGLTLDEVENLARGR